MHKIVISTGVKKPHNCFLKMIYNYTYIANSIIYFKSNYLYFLYIKWFILLFCAKRCIKVQWQKKMNSLWDTIFYISCQNMSICSMFQKIYFWTVDLKDCDCGTFWSSNNNLSF